jgi:hypothetical protein
MSQKFFKITQVLEYVVVAATHDTSYQNDAGGIKTSRRWLSEATPSGYEMGVIAAGTPAGAQAAYVASSSGGVVARAPQPPATGCDASAIVAIKKCH